MKQKRKERREKSESQAPTRRGLRSTTATAQPRVLERGASAVDFRRAVAVAGVLSGIYGERAVALVAKISGTPASRILENCEPLARVAVCILAVSGLRWGDVQNLKMADLIAGFEHQLIQKKTRRPVVVNFQNVFGADNVEASLLRWHAVQLSKSTVSSAIERACLKAGYGFPSSVRNKTHIFRHLKALHMKSQGYNLTEIATALGHATTDATQRYLNPLVYESTNPTNQE